MRGFAIALVLVVVPSARGANPGDRSVPASVQRQAESYATVILGLTQQIETEYVREVSQAELLEAALTGLYEAAREPIPGGLRADLARAAADKNFYPVLVEARARLGDNPAVADVKGVQASVQALPQALDPYCGLMPSNDFGYDDYDLGYGFELVGVRENRAALAPFQRGRIPKQDPAIPSLAPAVSLPIPWRIEVVIPGGPAQRAGLLPGDVLTHLDGKPITAESGPALFQEMASAPFGQQREKEFTFTVRREGKAEALTVKLAKGVFQAESVFGVRRNADNSWNFWLDEKEKIAQIRLGAIDRHSPQQMELALRRLQADGVRGLILDVRWCPGGYLNQAAEIAGQFLAEGKIATTKYRHPERQGQREYRADDTGLTRFRAGDFPILVLVNADTSGGGELIAAALKDNGRASVAGQRTRGKASVQSPITSPVPGMSFKLTSGTFVRPSGKNLQRFPESKSEDDWGVRPDRGREIPMTSDLSRQLKGWWTLQTLRAGSSREALPLDDPENDPQREAAKKMLRGLIEQEGKKGS